MVFSSHQAEIKLLGFEDGQEESPRDVFGILNACSGEYVLRMLT